MCICGGKRSMRHSRAPRLTTWTLVWIWTEMQLNPDLDRTEIYFYPNREDLSVSDFVTFSVQHARVRALTVNRGVSLLMSSRETSMAITPKMSWF